MELRAEVFNKQQLEQALINPNISLIYAPYDIITEKCFEDNNRIIIVPPVYLGDCEMKLAESLNDLRKNGFQYALAHTLGHIEMLSELDFTIFGGYRLNCTNSETVRFYHEQGVNDIIISPELTVTQINNLDTDNIGFIAYGFMPLMLTRRCPVKNGKPCSKKCCNKTITDRKGNKLNVTCNSNTAEILNSDVLYLADKQNQFKKASFAVLKFTVEQNIDDTINSYVNGDSPKISNFTRGLYFRGIKE